MSEPIAAQPIENVSRGSIFAAGAIPIAIVASALLGSFLGIASGIVALFVAYIAGFLYSKGSGGAVNGKLVGPAGRVPYIVIAVVAILLGTITSVVSATYAAFTSVGGDGGLFGGPFMTTLTRQLGNPENFLFPVALCFVFGAVGIVSVVRGPRNAPVATQPDVVFPSQPGAAAQPPQPGYPAQPAVYPTTDQAPAVPPAPAIPSAPPTALNQPSSGIILNGKPIDPSKQ